jgi:hypothetical protein
MRSQAARQKQVPVPESQSWLQQSPSNRQAAPLGAPDAPPQVPSHVPHARPPQQSASLAQPPPKSAHAFAH